MPDYEVEISAYPIVYPPRLTEDQCADLDTIYHLLITADNREHGEERAIMFLTGYVRATNTDWANVEFAPMAITELEPGESPEWSDYTDPATRPFDVRDEKMPFTRHNRVFDEPPPAPPPGLEHFADATTEELVTELGKSLEAEDTARAAAGLPPRHGRRPN